MFNSNSSANNSLKINAVSGLILKNHPKSWFERFNLKSNMAGRLLDNSPSLMINSNYNSTPVVVLQMMVCGDMEVIAEIVKKSDYEVVENG